MYEGKITGFRSPDVPVEELGRLMAGGSDSGEAPPSSGPESPDGQASSADTGDTETSTPAPGAGQ
jgi:hypothetical protein